MALNRGYLQMYILLMIGFVLLSLSNDILLLLGKRVSLLASVAAGALLFFFFYHLVTFIFYVKWQAPRVLFVLPVYGVISSLLFFILGITLGILNMMTAQMVFIITIISIVSALFQLGFTIFLISSFDPETYE